MSSYKNNDLSPYEIARLERIQRNEDRLRSLGLIGNPTLKPPKVTPPKKVKAKREKRKPSVPTRSSKRLKLLKDGMKQDDIDSKDSSDSSEEDVTITPEEEAEDDMEVNYDVMPKEPEQWMMMNFRYMFHFEHGDCGGRMSWKWNLTKFAKTVHSVS